MGEIEAQRLTHITHGAARLISDDGGGNGGALAPVLFVDVLDDLLAPLVLEVHVDIRRLVALPGDETLEKHLHARGIHLGYA